MKKILAVSGGVDSMAMLDMLEKAKYGEKSAERHARDEIVDNDNYASDEIIVTHFDHGIRENSRDDAEFVRRIADTVYHEMNIVGEGNLSGDISEEGARAARYEFLREVCRQNEPAVIYTAHHLDDLIETVAINLVRGTGWRGLAVLDSPGIRRPLLEAEICYEPMDKLAIYEYAAKRGLRFREDQTNSAEKYLRNRVRAQLAEEDWDYERKLKIWKLWRRQKELRREIDQTVTELLPREGEAWQREWFRTLEKAVAQELLRAGLLRAGIRATRPQIEDFRQAILTYAPGKRFNLPKGRMVKMGRREFWLEEERRAEER